MLIRKSGSESLSEEASDAVANGELGTCLSDWRIGPRRGRNRHRFVEDCNPGCNGDIGDVRNRRVTIKDGIKVFADGNSGDLKNVLYFI